MKTDHIEYPKLRAIAGTDLAYILCPIAVNQKNGFDKYIDYLASKTNGAVIINSKPTQRVLREYGYKIYKRHGKPLNKLEKDIKENSADLVGDMAFDAVGQSFEPDDNGNLLLRSYGSDLENVMIDGGDVLINSNGKVLRNTRGHMFIHKCDAFGNYPCDVFVSKTYPLSDKVDIIRLDYNFLTSDGHLVKQQNFQRSETPVIKEISRTYNDKTDEKVFVDSSKLIYPKAYVYDGGKNDGQFPMFFPSATALLIENRTRIQEGEQPIVDNETPYLIEHYQRQQNIPFAQRKLSEKSARGTIPYSTYIKTIELLSNEEMMTRIFSEFETKTDLEILNALEAGEDLAEFEK